MQKVEKIFLKRGEYMIEVLSRRGFTEVRLAVVDIRKAKVFHPILQRGFPGLQMAEIKRFITELLLHVFYVYIVYAFCLKWYLSHVFVITALARANVGI